MQLKKLYKYFLTSTGVEIDSTKVKKGNIFFAVGNKNENGVHRGCNYAENAFENGAEWLVINDIELKKKYSNNDHWILVEDCEKTLQDLSSYHRTNLKIPFIAIAGSNGKTTTKELLSQILAKKYSCFSTPGNLNNHLGVPLSILKIKNHHQIAVIEIGANHLEETEFLCRIAKPDFGILTNCGKDHLGEYGSVENIVKANKELYDYLETNNGKAFVNAADDLLVSISSNLPHKCFYGTESSGLNCEVLNSTLLSLNLKTPDFSIHIKTSLFGEFWKDSVMAAVKIGLYFDVEISLIKAALEAYKPSALRSEIISWNGHEVLLDCYNANPSSMEVFVDSVSKSPFTNKILILGEMLELGIYTEEEHQNLVNNFIPYENFDFVLFLGSAFRDIKLKYSNSLYFENTDELRAVLFEKLPDAKYHIFVKGSRSNKLEKVFDR